MGFVVIGLMVLLLRWAFGRGTSVVESPPRTGSPTEYGLLDPIASPETYIEAELLRQRLESAHIRATVAMTNDGPRLMVWPQDKARALELI
jgi:hypothetical protein